MRIKGFALAKPKPKEDPYEVLKQEFIHEAKVVSKIKGVFFGDYSYNAQNHDAVQENMNAFSIRRVYFTFENSISKDIKTRFRLESKHDLLTRRQ